MRNTTISIMKGLCMFLVVAGHTNCPFTRFIYLFHMPVFFMISGYLLKEKYFSNIKSLSELFRRRILRIWIPYVTSNTFFLFLSGFTFNKTFFYKMLKILFFCCEPPLGDASWFLSTLFGVTIFFSCISYITRRLSNKRIFIIHTLLAIGLLYFSFFCQQNSIGIKLVFLRIFSVYSIFSLGYLYHQKNICAKWPYILLPSIAGGIILLFSQNLIIDLGSNIYTSPFLLILFSLSGWHFIYSLAMLCEKFLFPSFIFSYFGDHTMPVLLFHWLCFSLTTKIPLQFSWWLKTLLGILIPLIICGLFKKVNTFLGNLRVIKK